VVNQPDYVVDFLVGFPGENFRLRTLPYIFREFVKQFGGRVAEQMLALELIRRGPRATGETERLGLAFRAVVGLVEELFDVLIPGRAARTSEW
jgi:hypothetical protein